MINEDDIMLWLDSFDFMTYKKKEKFLSLVENPTDYVTLGKLYTLKNEILKVIEEDELKLLISTLNETSIGRIKENLDKIGRASCRERV